MARKIIVLRQQVAPRDEDGVVYMECIKNHSAHLGLHAIDGCGEFMASAPSPDRPEAELTCDAWGCYRDYHRMKLKITRWQSQASQVSSASGLSGLGTEAMNSPQSSTAWSPR
ncbi:hypothetical protein SASPL_130928 [Salvia splendens]|uniref:ZF-HD dimerization-type domain-containing protein n=1 Tax=Salvia splendens TaxID=180675 RepID=A0A8X8X946_SALSN|nr:hypothetical protein SASPL_130928 [Salvia splendens]